MTTSISISSNKFDYNIFNFIFMFLGKTSILLLKYIASEDWVTAFN